MNSKKLLVSGVSLLAALSLTACGSKSGSSSTSTSSQATSKQTSHK